MANPKNMSQNWKLLKESLKSEESCKRNRPSTSEDDKTTCTLTRTKRRKLEKLKKNRKEIDEKKEHKQKLSSRFVSMDCEFVGAGLDARQDMLARVSIVDDGGGVLLDRYVSPQRKVTDYRTRVSGIRRTDLLAGHPFYAVQNEVRSILAGKILIGHGIEKDLEVLQLTHPRTDIRDTAVNKALRAMSDHGIGKPSLKKLASCVLGVQIQQGEHDSVTDARIAMRLFQMVQHKGSQRTAVIKGKHTQQLK